MALAVLTIETTSANVVEAMADIGSNTYYEYLIGRKDESAYGSRWGDDEMAEVTHRSGLQSAPAGFDPFSRKFRFQVPLAHFDRDHPHLQLISYTDPAGNSAARSRIFRVAPVIGATRTDISEYEHGVPLGSLSTRCRTSDGRHQVRPVPLAFQESAISRAQFVDGLLQVIQAVAPTLIQALPQLIGAIGGGESRGRGETGARGGLSIDTLVELLRLLVAAPPSGRGTTTTPSTSPPPLPPAAPAEAASLCGFVRHPLGRALSERRYAAAFGTRRVPFGRAMDAGLLSGPMLAALLGPLLQQAPQLLGVLADKPLDFLATVIRAEAENDLQREANQQAFIRNLLAETNRSLLLDQLVQRMGGDGAASLLPLLTQTQSLSGRPKAEASRAVNLKFEIGRPMEIGKKLKSVFAPIGNGIDLRILLDPTGRAPLSPLPRAQAELVVIDTVTGDTLLNKSYRLREIYAGKAVPLHLEEELLAKLPRHRDLQVTVKLRWPTAQGRVLGVRGHHAICLADTGPVFAGFGRTQDTVIHLAHPSDNRPFWSRIWEGTTPSGSDRSRWEIDVLCRYYVRVTGSEDSNGRMETRIAPQANGKAANESEITGRMRAGMEFSIDMLNQILAEHQTALTPTELAALKQADLRAELDMEATTRLRLRGKEGQLGAIWAFPSLMLREAHFLEPTARDDYGQVTEMRRIIRSFPVPDRVHFLMMRSKR
jgi:hypothetical protein